MKFLENYFSKILLTVIVVIVASSTAYVLSPGFENLTSLRKIQLGITSVSGIAFLGRMWFKMFRETRKEQRG